MMYVPTPVERLIALKAILLNRRYTATEKNVAAYLLASQNSKDGRCDPSYETIATALGIARRSAIRAIKAIEAAGDVALELRRNALRGMSSNQFNFAFCRLGFGGSAGTKQPELSTPPSDPGVTPRPAPSDPGVTTPVTLVTLPLVTLVSPKQGEVNMEKRTQESLFGEMSEAFDFDIWFEQQWWPLYPRREAKKEAKKTCERILRKGEATADDLVAGVLRYAKSEKVSRGFVKLPAGWLNGALWNDELTSQPHRSSALVAGEGQSAARGGGWGLIARGGRR
jgi:hypothetical protein